MKKFIITIDTEGDNQWDWKPGKKITTNNTDYLKRFQSLCDKYSYKPVWLSNYEMIQDDNYVKFIKDVVESGRGEIGMHLHAWSTPPHYDLPIEKNGAPYLIEFPYDVMEQKISVMTDFIINRTGIKPVSHRAGRWATNQDYFNLLIKYGYLVDCSVTPHIDWSSNFGQTSKSKGSDYSNAPIKPYFINSTNDNKSIFEVPVTIMRSHSIAGSNDSSSVKRLAKNLINSVRGRNLWIRPNGNNLEDMLRVVFNNINNDLDYIMFMIHSSELMPGGSPSFKNTDSIDKLYDDLNILFNEISKNYSGITLDDYRKEYNRCQKSTV